MDVLMSGLLPVTSPVKASLVLSFEFLRLYINAFAFQANLNRAPARDGQEGSGKTSGLFDDLASKPDARFIYESIDAASSLLSILNSFIDPVAGLKCMPLKYCLYVIYAAVFLFKVCHVFAGPSIAKAETDIQQGKASWGHLLGRRSQCPPRHPGHDRAAAEDIQQPSQPGKAIRDVAASVVEEVSGKAIEQGCITQRAHGGDIRVVGRPDARTGTGAAAGLGQAEYGNGPSERVFVARLGLPGPVHSEQYAHEHVRGDARGRGIRLGAQLWQSGRPGDAAPIRHHVGRARHYFLKTKRRKEKRKKKGIYLMMECICVCCGKRRRGMFLAAAWSTNNCVHRRGHWIFWVSLVDFSFLFADELHGRCSPPGICHHHSCCVVSAGADAIMTRLGLSWPRRSDAPVPSHSCRRIRLAARLAADTTHARVCE